MSSTGLNFLTILKRLAAGERLSAEDATHAFSAVMTGTVSEARMAALLTALSLRGPTVAEITGAARAMRASMMKVDAPLGAIDVCGTGGDGLGTLNVSTAAAFVVAACGVAVAKHGNRAMSSSTGAADVLEVLGIPINDDAQTAAEHLRDIRFSFLFAPLYHPAMKHVGHVRRELGFRTIFNVIGPICNPAQVKRQLIGVFSPDWLEPVAEVLRDLGTEKAWVVHGSDGLDELTTTSKTQVAVLEEGKITRCEIAPEDVSLKRATLAELKGGSAGDNALAIRNIFSGAKNAFRDIVILNAAAAIHIADKASTLAEGIKLATEAIDQGRAATTLKRARLKEPHPL